VVHDVRTDRGLGLEKEGSSHLGAPSSVHRMGIPLMRAGVRGATRGEGDARIPGLVAR
jgi:hypothetical protein